MTCIRKCPPLTVIAVKTPQQQQQQQQHQKHQQNQQHQQHQQNQQQQQQQHKPQWPQKRGERKHVTKTAQQIYSQQHYELQYPIKPKMSSGDKRLDNVMDEYHAKSLELEKIAHKLRQYQGFYGRENLPQEILDYEPRMQLQQGYPAPAMSHQEIEVNRNQIPFRYPTQQQQMRMEYHPQQEPWAMGYRYKGK